MVNFSKITFYLFIFKDILKSQGMSLKNVPNLPPTPDTLEEIYTPKLTSPTSINYVSGTNKKTSSSKSKSSKKSASSILKSHLNSTKNLCQNLLSCASSSRINNSPKYCALIEDQEIGLNLCQIKAILCTDNHLSIQKLYKSSCQAVKNIKNKLHLSESLSFYSQNDKNSDFQNSDVDSLVGFLSSEIKPESNQQNLDNSVKSFSKTSSREPEFSDAENEMIDLLIAQLFDANYQSREEKLVEYLLRSLNIDENSISDLLNFEAEFDQGENLRTSLLFLTGVLIFSSVFPKTGQNFLRSSRTKNSSPNNAPQNSKL